jgi:putative PIN family toxin of toxin-antitoxin system
VTLPIAVIDTNVVVSGLLTGERASPTAAVLDGMVRARFAYLLSLDLLAEYREVLLRPRISRRHGLGDADVESILTELALNGRVCQPPTVTGTLPDPGDRHLWALLESDPTAVLVTGDAALQGHAPHPGRVLSPRRFLVLLGAQET